MPLPPGYSLMSTQGPPGPLISVVTPALNEAEAIGELLAALAEVAERNHLQLEIIVVDDGSTDGTWERLLEAAGADPRIRGIRLRRTFGKAAALAAGFAAARGDVIVTIDADLQDDPQEIPLLLAKLEVGLDAVSGWKQQRQDPWHKVWASRLFNYVVGLVSGVRLHDHNCGLKAYRRAVVEELQLYGELHRFIPVLAHARGFKVGEVVVRHRPRRHGRSKFGAQRLVRGALDLLTVMFLTGYRYRPLHLIGGVGLLAFVAGAAGLGYLAVLWLMGHRPIGDRPLLTYSLLSNLLGTQLMAVGFLAELLTTYHVEKEKPYHIAEQTPTPP